MPHVLLALRAPHCVCVSANIDIHTDTHRRVGFYRDKTAATAVGLNCLARLGLAKCSQDCGPGCSEGGFVLASFCLLSSLDMDMYSDTYVYMYLYLDQHVNVAGPSSLGLVFQRKACSWTLDVSRRQC